MNDQSRRAEPGDPQVAAALRDYLERVDRGEPVDRDEFLARHAPIAEQLRSFIDADDDLRKLAGAATPLDRAHDSTTSFVRHGQETVAPQPFAQRSAEAAGSGLAGQFGRYRIIQALGRGAMGAVYLAEDTQLGRQVAIKTPHFTEDPTGEQLERFFREARAAGNLRHPHICPIYDVGQIDGKHYISMAYIEGRPLSAFIRADKPQTERNILIVVRKLALALQEAHDHGIVHRDLKPANIMVDKRGEPIIMDFGLARQTGPGDIRLTQTGSIIGTPAYMSPEQVEGEPDNIGPPTDQYGLGVILYELLTRELPFRGSVMAVMGQILTRPVTPPSQLRADLDPRIEAVCLKMMAKAASDRFASLKAVADQLAAILKSPAENAASQNKPGPALSSADRMRPDGGASQALKSLAQKSLTQSDLASLEELAQKCLARRDYDQVIQVIERIPAAQRTAELVALLENARAKADEITFLICEIDEAERLGDAQSALEKAESLLKLKPGHHRAREIQEKYSGYREGRAARIAVLDQFRRPLNDGGWIPWSALAFGLVVFGVMTGAIVIYLNKTAIVIDIEDPDVEVSVKGTTLTVTGPDRQSVKVVPGDQELTITCNGLETVTKSFTIKKGEKRTVTVSILDSKLVAWLDNESGASTSGPDQKMSNPTAGSTGPSPPLTSAHKEQKGPEKEPEKEPGREAETQVVKIPPQTGAGSTEVAAADQGQTPSTPGFIPLFNGRDLAGWHLAPGSPGTWRVVKGVLIGSGSKQSYLDSERDDFRDFDLRVEARLSAGGESGVYFRTMGGYAGYQADIRDPRDGSTYRTGTLTGPRRGTVNFVERLVRDPEWFNMRVLAEGNRIRIFVNDRQTVDYTDAERSFTSGRISLQQVHPATTIEFRRIEIRELPPAAMESPRSGIQSAEDQTPRKQGENLLVNGSFEEGHRPRKFKSFNAGSTEIPGWKVTRGQIDILGGLNAAFDGTNSVDLHGTPGFGGIEQTFKTVRGHRYRVTFAATVTPTAKHPVKRIGASAAGTKRTFTVESKIKTKWSKPLDWTLETFEFTAAADETTLEIYTLDTRDPFLGPLIDDVRVIEEEPNTGAAARSFVQLLHRGEFDQAFAQFNADMQNALPADHLKKAWQKVLAEAGAYKTILETRTETSGISESVTVTCAFTKHARDVRVVFRAGKISGLWFPLRRSKE